MRNIRIEASTAPIEKVARKVSQLNEARFVAISNIPLKRYLAKL